MNNLANKLTHWGIAIWTTFLWGLAAILMLLTVELYLYPDDLGMGTVIIIFIIAFAVWYWAYKLSAKLTRNGHYPVWVVLGLFVTLLLILLEDSHVVEMLLGVVICIGLFCQGWYIKKHPAGVRGGGFRPVSGYQASIKRLRQLALLYTAPHIDAPEMYELVSTLQLITEKIHRLSKDDSNYQLRNANFEDYYLPKALKLLEEYTTLSHGPSTHLATTQALMGKISAVLPSILQVFEQSLDDAYTDAYHSFSTEIEVLEQMIRLENLNPEEI